MKVGLSLSGGAARGLIHIGAMEELEKAEIPVDMIAGCSIGAIIGALYSLNPDIEHVKERITEFLETAEGEILPVTYLSDEVEKERRSIVRTIANSLKRTIYYGISLTQISLLSTDHLKKSISKLLPDIDISECKIPFCCSATDLTNNRAHYFTKGSLIDAVTASCSIPGLYPPVEIDGMALVDGGWSAMNHTDQLREIGADFIIAVDIQRENEEGELSNGLDVALRSNVITRKVLSDLQLRGADVIIQPDVCHINWWDFANSGQCLVLGKDRTTDQMAEIKRKLRRAKIRKLFR